MSTLTRAESLALLGRAVSRLATPHSMVVQQRDPNTDTIVRVSVTREPLILMLRNAVLLSSSSGHGGGGEDAAKVPLNSAAYDVYRNIRGDVQRAWQGITPDMLTLPKTWPTHYALAGWHSIWLPIAAQHVSPIADEDAGLIAAIFDHHRSTIEDMFNPPTQITLYGKTCPRCGKTRGHKGADEVPALLITIDPLGTPRAACRACNHIWDGDAAVKQLKRDIDHLALLASNPPDIEPAEVETEMLA